MKTRCRLRLSMMMALVYSVQGAFWPVLAVHLEDMGLPSRSRGWIFGTLALGSLVVPLGAGRLVDRSMATQRFLALAYSLGAGVLAVLASELVIGERPLFLLFLAYWCILAPAYGLSNSLAMRHLGDAPEEFGGVRLWGTVGWMASGWLVSLVMLVSGSTAPGRGAYEALRVAAVLACITAAYCLTLPDTPPLPDPEPSDDTAGGAGSGWRPWHEPGVTVLLISAMGVSLTTPSIYQVIPGYLESRGLARAWSSAAMSLGQWPEILSLAALPRILRRAGYKGTLALGIAAWFARFSMLTLDPPLWLAISGGIFHGVGVGCFTVVAQVYLDSKAPSHRRASVQGLYLVTTAGLGSLLGSLLAGELASGGDGVRAGGAFLYPCVINGALLIYFLKGFRSHVSSLDRGSADLPLRPLIVRGTAARVGTFVTESADG